MPGTTAIGKDICKIDVPMLASVTIPEQSKIPRSEIGGLAAAALGLGEPQQAMIACLRASDESDDLAPARGLLNGLVIAVVIWAGLVAFIAR